MPSMPTFDRQFGTKKWSVKTADIDPLMTERVQQAVGEAKAALSPYMRVERMIGESTGAYQKRLQTDDPDDVRRPDETPEQHAKRVLTAKNTDMELALGIMNRIAPILNQPEVTKDDICAAGSWILTKDFLWNVLNFCDAQVLEFFPKSVQDSTVARV